MREVNLRDGDKLELTLPGVQLVLELNDLDGQAQELLIIRKTGGKDLEFESPGEGVIRLLWEKERDRAED